MGPALANAFFLFFNPVHGWCFCIFRYGYFGKEALKEVKLLVCTIDGCLTTGHIYVSEDEKEILSYDVRDAVGINLLQKRGVEVWLGLRMWGSWQRAMVRFLPFVLEQVCF